MNFNLILVAAIVIAMECNASQFTFSMNNLKYCLLEMNQITSNSFALQYCLDQQSQDTDNQVR